jgi:3-methyladenine DNA glycosylase AlkD
LPPESEKKIRRQLAEIRRTFKENSDPERARNEKRYLKSPHKFFGVTLPFIRKAAREFRRANKDARPGYVFALASALWGSEYHQEKTLAIKILEEYKDCLDIDAMPMLERMLKEAAGWDHVDGIAIHLAGAVLERDGRAYKYLRRWSMSENFWMRRAALISQILPFRHGKGDNDLFFGFAGRMLGEKEFFIRKAIGWTLRELSKSDPGAVFDFLMKHKDRASGLTLREGSRGLSEGRKKKLLGK